MKRLHLGRVFRILLIENRWGYISFETDNEKFLDECGGHRFQRVPPNERNGRVHTSTVTVACLNASQNNYKIEELDWSKIEIEYYRSGGPGGQNKNKTETACRIKYGDIIVTNSDQRSQRQNYEAALKTLKTRITDSITSSEHLEQNNQRRKQIGSGQRGDKIKTYREKDDIVINHKTDKKLRMSDVMDGKIW